jgi:hypothetical protein
MKKSLFFILTIGVLLASAAMASAQLRAGESAIFFKSGDVVIDRIIDVSSTRLVLQTQNSGEFPLRDVWMINYVNDQWNFPNERNQIETNETYFFLKSGDIISGRIIDFSSRQIVFELEGGEKIQPGRIRRIYFSKRVPAALQNQNNQDNQGDQGGDPAVGTYRSIAGSNVELGLGPDGTARVTMLNGGRTWLGTWGYKPGDAAILIVRVNEGGKLKTQHELTFGRGGNELLGLNFDKALFGQTLRLRKTN